MANKYAKPFYLVTALFFMVGLITVLVDSLIPRIKEIFELSYFQAGLVQFAFFVAYGLISIPTGAILQKTGFKKGIIIGLGIMGLACLLFLPAASYRLFSLFLISYFTLAAGMTILQVAINPYVTLLGEPEGASSRLNLSQAFNSLGTTIAPALGSIFILSDKIKDSRAIGQLNAVDLEAYLSTEAAAVQVPFVGLALSLLLMALIVMLVKLPQVINTVKHSDYGKALKHKKLRMGALGIFVYVGSEVAIGSYLVNYFLDMNLQELIRDNSFMAMIASLLHAEDLSQIDGKAVVGVFVTFYWGGAMLGRFIGSYLTRILAPNKVLMSFALLAISCLFISMLSQGFVSMFSILAVGLFNSIMFPTIFAISIEDLAEVKAQGSGILCTAIAGGAFIPPLYGLLTDLSGFKWALLLLVLCYGYIAFFAKRASKLNPKHETA